MAKQKVVLIPPEDTAKWLCTFNDLMTLLLTFFVLLLSMSSLDSKSVKDVQANLINALGVMEEGTFHEETVVEKLFKLEEIGKRQKLFKNILPPVEEGIEQEERIEDITPPQDLLKDFIIVKEEGIKQVEDEEFVFNQFREILNENYYEPGITIMKKERGVVLRLADHILFSPGTSELSPKAYELLNKVANVLKKTNLNMYIEGHTDSIPIKTVRYPSNWELSVARAVTVVMYMIENMAVPPAKIGVSGYADSEPVAPNNTAENRKKNRRLEIILSRF